MAAKPCPSGQIPHITIDECRFSPDELAKGFAGKSDQVRIQLPGAYHLVNGKPEPVHRRQWNDVIRQLDGLEAELRRRFGDGNDGDAEWSRRSTEQLPDAFVWRDEFQIAWNEYVEEWSESQQRLQRAIRGAEQNASNQEQLRRVGALQDHPPHIDLTPMQSAEIADIVLAGFTSNVETSRTGSANEQRDRAVVNDEDICKFSEMVHNGNCN